MSVLGPILPARIALPQELRLVEVPGLAYFSAPRQPVPALRELTALEQMYAYFGSDRA